jgi:hypothetical protein
VNCRSHRSAVVGNNGGDCGDCGDADKVESSLVRLEVITAVTMKNGVFWDIKTQFVPHRKHITSPQQGSAG